MILKNGLIGHNIKNPIEQNCPMGINSHYIRLFIGLFLHLIVGMGNSILF